MTYCIYLHINHTNGKGYVGLTSKSMGERWLMHVKRARQGGTSWFYQAIRKYGQDAFDHHELAINVQTLQEAKDLECAFIAALKTHGDPGGYNMTHGGDGTGGFISEATRLKMKVGATRRPPVSAETRTKKSLALRGRKFSEVHRLRISESARRRTGRHHSDETRQKQRESNRETWADPDLRLRHSELTRERKRACQAE